MLAAGALAAAIAAVAALPSLLASNDENPTAANGQPTGVRRGPPGNDNYLTSATVPLQMTKAVEDFQDTVQTADATVQADLFDPDGSGRAHHGGGPERTLCDGAKFGKTIWYGLRTRAPGGIEVTASGFDAVVALYERDRHTSKISRLVRCQQGSTLNTEDLISPPLHPGRYAIQIGGVERGGEPVSGRLDIHVGLFRDGDGDGELDATDRCPARRGPARTGGCPS